MTASTSSSVSAVGVVHARPRASGELRERLLDIVEWARAEPGCLHSVVQQDANDPDCFVFYETWASQADLDRHLSQPHMNQFLAKVEGLISKPLEVRPLVPAETNSRPALDPAAMNDEYLAAYAERDLDALMAVYAPGAAAVWEPGKTVSGETHRAAIETFLPHRPELSATVRDCFIAGDTAALVVDWAIDVPGAPEHSGTGTGFDVLRREPDGRWRYIITNPFGRS